MNFKFLSAAVAALALAGCQTPPSTQVSVSGSEVAMTRTLNVASGATVKAGFWAHVNPDCTNAGDSAVRVIQAPVQGTLDVSKTTGFAYFAPNNPRSECNNRRVAGTQITYRSRAGFIGTDTYSLEVFSPSGLLVKTNVIVNVR